MTQEEPVPPALRAELIDTFAHPLRSRVLAAIHEHPGATVKQISVRIDVPVRKVRHQLEILAEAGLVFVEDETSRRNTRERHYRAAVKRAAFSEEPNIADLIRVAVRLLVEDLRRATAAESFATERPQSAIRIPGFVDEEGFSALSQLMDDVMAEVECVMEESAARLEASGEPGISVISALLLFEAASWDLESDQ